MKPNSNSDEPEGGFLGRKYYRLPASAKECKAIEEMVELQKQMAYSLSFKIKMFPN